MAARACRSTAAERPPDAADGLAASTYHGAGCRPGVNRSWPTLGQVAAAIIAATILHFPCPFNLYPSIIRECPCPFTLDSSINPDLLHPDLLPRFITPSCVVQRQSNLSPRLLIHNYIVSLHPNISPFSRTCRVRVHPNQLSLLS